MFTAANLETRLDTQMASLLGDAYSGAARTAIKEGLLRAIATAVVECITEEAQVSFLAGQITGADVPQGNTHGLLIASGGGIS